MVMYIEACHAGSMFENLLPEDINGECSPLGYIPCS